MSPDARPVSPQPAAAASPVVDLRGVGVTVSGNDILADVDLRLSRGGHLAVLGPNGSGKTTLLRVLSTYRFPTRGVARVLGLTFGAGDLRTLRHRIGFVSVALDPLTHVASGVLPLVAASRRGELFPMPGVLDGPGVREACARALARVGAGHLDERRVDTLSQGELQRVRIARALATEPELLLLDEPFAGLDLGGREALLADLEALLDEPEGPTVVLVTHHLEELPSNIDTVLLLRGGRPQGTGDVEELLTDEHVSDTFGLPIRVTREQGRWSARRQTPQR